MMDEVASTLLTFNLDQTEPDVPSALRHGRRLMPLGRYLHRRLRTLVGKAPESPEAVQAENKAEMLRMREAALDGGKRKSITDVYLEENAGKLINTESVHNLRKQKRSL